MRQQANTIRKDDRQSWQNLATNVKAEPMHRHLALVHLRKSNARAFHDKCMQILHDAD